MNGKLRVVGIGLALPAMAGLVLLLVRPSIDPARIRPLPLLIAAWIAFIAAAWLLRQVPRRTSVALILLGGIALQVAAVSAPPQNSNDLYRYINIVHLKKNINQTYKIYLYFVQMKR